MIGNCAKAQTLNLVGSTTTVGLLSLGQLYEGWYIYHGY